MEYINQVREESESSEFAYKQFLGFFRVIETFTTLRETIKEMPKKSKIRAFTSKLVKIQKKGVLLFNFPEDMLKISTVAHRRQKNIYLANQDNEKYYQRIIKKKAGLNLYPILKRK